MHDAYFRSVSRRLSAEPPDVGLDRERYFGDPPLQRWNDSCFGFSFVKVMGKGSKICLNTGVGVHGIHATQRRGVW